MRIGFVLSDLRLSGGLNAVLQHASRIAGKGSHQVFFFVREVDDSQSRHPLLKDIKVVCYADWPNCTVDIAVATYWETLLMLGEIPSAQYVWFCQSFEDRFFPDRNPNMSTMQIAGSLPIPVIAVAHWISDLLGYQNPDRTVEVVLNGIDKEVFTEVNAPHNPGEGFSILIEGSLDELSKNTRFSLEGSLKSNLATKITHVGNRRFETNDPRYNFVENTLNSDDMAEMYRSHHIQVKASLVEGMFGPPLEGFHCGLPAVVTPVTGAEEYIEDDVNSVVVPWGDSHGLAWTLDSLARDRKKWKVLQDGARRTAHNWSGWGEQAEAFEESLLRVATSSKLTQSDLSNLGRAIEYGNLMHWLAMRRLSDKSAGPGVMEAKNSGPVGTKRSVLRSAKKRLLGRRKTA